MKPPPELLRQIEQFDCPLVTAVLSVILHEKGCLYLLDQEELIGCSREALEIDPYNQAKRIARALRVTDEIMEMLERIIGVDKKTISLFVAFEAGRRYEREHASLAELEKMFREEKEGRE
jgi:hypothetical protein